MVSYTISRARFLIKAGNVRQVHQKHQQQQQHTQQQQQQQHYYGKWNMLRKLRRFSSKTNHTDAKIPSASNESGLIHNSAFPKATGLKARLLKEAEIHAERRNSWTRWTGLLLRFAPFGFCVFGAIEWQLHKRKCDQEEVPRTASEFQSKVYCSLPLRIISRCWGWLAACYIPMSLRPYVYGWYSNAFNVNLEEALYPSYEHYPSLAEFFTRPLRHDARIIDKQAPLVSPADGKVLHFGTANKSLIEQVKGVNYSLQAFLGPPTWTEKNKEFLDDYGDAIKEKPNDTTGLYQCVIYLAPGDYHRFHSPADWTPTIRRHFAGELLSVSPKIATWLPGLFCLNERALYMGKWQYGFFSYTAVGATNVGSVQIYMDDKLKTNRWVGLKVGTHKKYEEFDELPLNENKKLLKGDLVGQFNMGSTIVLLFEAPKDFQFTIDAGQKIRVGEPLGFIGKKQ